MGKLEDPYNMGALLSDARAASGLTQDEPAQRTGIQPGNVSRALGCPKMPMMTARKNLTVLRGRLGVESPAPKLPESAAPKKSVASKKKPRRP